ncbi:acetyl-CoA synthetase-like protein [Trichoderma longibrachiatum ATCC 18648]|uniref:Acetyl-CoA synthetase-like protein n=1 Tax=Trichoderma longibrachiatum ATCC 18648 TaxID=983965 RepID=A0A2T4BX22_TRILO|nr:acetyl-CoA synthetase-like protein [Trichoderma longibrachiatum ATCC 18648]
MIYTNPRRMTFPDLDLLTFLFEYEGCQAKEDSPLFAEAKYPSHILTTARVRDLTRQFAYFLRHQYGIGRDGPARDVVVSISTGQSALGCLFYAVLAADGIYSAASPASTVSDLTRQIKDGPGKVVVCSEDVKGVALSAARDAGLPARNVLVLKSYPEIQLKSADGETACDSKGSLDWRRITDPKELENSKACIVYSSGTTGLPKGVLVSHQNMVSECYLPGTLGREAWERMGKSFPRSTLGHLPAAHIAGLQSYFINAVYDGALTYWMPSFNFDDFVRYFAELRLTFFFSVPPIFMAIAKHPAVVDQFKSVEYATSAAAPMSYELQEAASKKLKGIVYQVWGLSETTGAVTYTPPDRADTMGSLSPLLPNVSLRLVDENDNDVEEGQPGEALLKGPMVTKGYHNNPEANRESFTKDGWFRTGDVLKREGDVFYLVDRKKELIKYKGLQVAPAELEGVLTAHPSVADAAVIGTKREDTEVPTAYVALTVAARGKVSEAELVDYVRSKVADYKRLRGGVVFVDAIPRSPTGKILRKDLRALHSRHVRPKI